MLVLSQINWTPSQGERLQSFLSVAQKDASRFSLGRKDGALVVLPHCSIPHLESEAFATLSGIAKSLGIYLAGSAVLRESNESVAQTLGFLFDTEGKLALRVGKITPDLVEGFTDTKTLAPQDATFPVARLPIGNIAILCGEDIAIAQYSRSLAFNGAEVILNPSSEYADLNFEMRRKSRYGRASDIVGYIACATPRARTEDGVEVTLPTASALYNWERELIGTTGQEDFLYYNLDMEALRRRRGTPQMTMPAIVRANLYGDGYEKWASEAPAFDLPQTRDGWIKAAKARMEAEAKRCGPTLPKYEEQYDVLAIQTVPRLITLGLDPAEARRIMLRNLDDNLELAGSRANIPSVRLVVFPEFWLTGPGGIGGIQRTVQDMELLSISAGDEIFERIGAFAKEHNVYVAFQNFEVHEKLPGRVFNAAFLISDKGELIHTYRKQQCADVWGLLPDTTPGSIYDQYLEVFGYEGLFPVADTPIGRLANMICFDNMSPEVAFGLRYMGAEVILHSSSEPHGAEGRAPWDNVRLLRAYENCAYVVSAMDGGEHVSADSEHLTYFRRGHTRIVNFDGTLQGTVDGPGPVPLRGHIDLAGLRARRADPFSNLMLWNDPVAYANIYCGDVGFPSNLWAGDPYVNPYLGAKKLREVIQSYYDRGIYIEAKSEIGTDRFRTGDLV